MSVLAVMAAAAVLGLVPLLLDGLGRRISPRLVVGFDMVAISASATAVTAAAVLLAAPPVFRLFELDVLARICDRLLVHLGVALPPSIGWVGPVALLWIGTRAVTSIRRSVRQERRLREAATPAFTVPTVPYPVHFAELRQRTAFSLRGAEGVIVVSRELAEALEQCELLVVLHHEAAHLRYRHGWILRLLGALETTFGHLPGFSASVRATRLALERWADESALEASGCDREVAKQALLKATGVDSGITPSLSTIDSIVRRLRALSEGPPRPLMWPGIVVGTLVAVFAGVALAGFYTWVSHGHAALALAGWCPV